MMDRWMLYIADCYRRELSSWIKDWVAWFLNYQFFVFVIFLSFSVNVLQ